MSSRRRPSTLAVHAGELGRKIHHSITTPIFQSATFTFDRAADVRAYHEAKVKDRYEYGRYGSPTQLTLEKKLAELYGAEEALASASGMSALASTFLALLAPGDHVVLTSECYRRTRVMAEKLLARAGIRSTFGGTTAESLLKAVTPRTRMIFVEMPTNPHLHVPDLPKIAAVARRKRILLVVDATIAGPFNIDPFALGADLVVLSLTKYLAGHNDVIAGAVLGPRRLLEAVRDLHGTLGSLLPPHSAWLVIRGMKTVSLRLARQTENAERIAFFLAGHKRVKEVFHPRLPSHPDHEIAKRLLKGCGSLVSFRLRGSLASVEAFLDRLKVFQIAASLGGVESFAESIVTMSHWSLKRRERARIGMTDDLVRLSCGIEDPEDLIADLARALAKP